MKVIAVIPAKGRLPLLKLTIERLLKKNGCDEVVVIADTMDEEKVIKAAGAHFVRHANQPLGKKWNAGFEFAKKLKPDVVLFVGSSDWVSDNWLPELLPFMEEYDLIGKRDFTMMDIPQGEEKSAIRMSHWEGYGPGLREKEPIGIGRLVSARILHKMNWHPFDDTKNNSMDWQMYMRALQHGGTVGLVNGDHLVSLSISTNAWSNLHKFEDHWNDVVPSKSHRIEKMAPYFKMFPEYKEIFK